ncbi:MAG: hypothetical protein JKX85_02230 [Phycisphaeraceae bacterium]|nr:hypothetical protein [Phycisphaeraceae bacterium]
MNKFLAILILFATTLIASVQENKPHEASHQDMLSPQYYQAATGATFKTKVDKFISASRKKTFHHPLQKDSDKTPRFSVKNWGKFGAGKGQAKTNHTTLPWTFKWATAKPMSPCTQLMMDV